MTDISLAEKILDTIEADEEHDGDDIFEALLQVFTFFLSMQCPNCRKKLSQELRRSIPGMLAAANRNAAGADDSAEDSQLH